MIKEPPNNLINPLSLKPETIQTLSQQYGTPIYIYNSDIITERWKILKSFLPDYINIYYSIKANPNPEVINAFKNLGARFEAASIGEINIVQNKGCGNAEKIIFVGPAKSDYDLEKAIEQKVYIIAESANELERINAICQNKGIVQSIAIRINPGKGNGTISTGGKTQFGIDINTLPALSRSLSKYKNILVNGLHFYLGTGILQEKLIIDNLKIILEATKKAIYDLKIDLQFLDIGGGLGIPYHENENELNLTRIKDDFVYLIDTFRKEVPSLKEIAFEAGRYLVGPSGIFAAKVIDIKSSFGIQYIILDGGTSNFNIDTHYYGFKSLPFSVFTDNPDKHDIYTICGPLCTSTDRLEVDIRCQIPNIGDIIAFYQAGAYGFSASPGLFLSRGFPKEVFYKPI